jgi:hypothetical protein
VDGNVKGESARPRGISFDCARETSAPGEGNLSCLPGGRASGLSARLTRGDPQFATPGSTGKIYNANPVAFGWRAQKIFFCDVFRFKMSHGCSGRNECQAVRRLTRMFGKIARISNRIKKGRSREDRPLRLPAFVTN